MENAINMEEQIKKGMDVTVLFYKGAAEKHSII